MTLTPVAERLAVELSLPVFTTSTWVCRDQGSNPDLPHEANALHLRHRGGLSSFFVYDLQITIITRGYIHINHISVNYDVVTWMLLYLGNVSVSSFH